MHITLIRHGIAEDQQTNQDDYDRALTSHGRKKFLKSLEENKDILQTITTIICSPSLRTCQTCALLCSIIHIEDKNIIYDESLYNFYSYEILETSIHKNTQEKDSHICLIGHNNSISSLASYLTKTNIMMKKGDIINIRI